MRGWGCEGWADLCAIVGIGAVVLFLLLIFILQPFWTVVILAWLALAAFAG